MFTMDAAAANLPRCEGRKGTYEVWYLTVTVPEQKRGFWFRYTTFDPLRALGMEAHSALWAFSFHLDDPTRNTAAKAMLPRNALRVTVRPFKLRLGDAELDTHGCSGAFTSNSGSARWDLHWTSLDLPFPFLQPRWHALSATGNVAAHPAILVSGTIELNGQEYSLDRAYGGQQHTWGSTHALELSWGYSSGPGFWFDGATSRVRSLGGLVIGATTLGARLGNERFLLNSPLRVFANPGQVSSQELRADVSAGGRRLVVRVRPRPVDLIGVTLTDPRGGSRVCYHSELADLELRLFRGADVLAEMVKPGAAAFEYVSSNPLPGIPIRL